MDEVDYFACKYHVVGGNRPDNYAHNSEYQKEIIISAEDLIQELTIKNLSAADDLSRRFAIADLGCSIGPNAFIAVSNIIKAVRTEWATRKPDDDPPEFQVFFNDLIDNDFNALFRNLMHSKPDYFAASVPGSFHGRLFPKGTIHFAHCSTTLHWLSKIPDEVRVMNPSRVHYSGAKREVKEAYSAQYRRDMEGFLNARGVEIVDGGLMVLLILGFPEGVELSESSIGVTFEILGSCLQDLALEGKVKEEEVDSFNLPFYYPTPMELKAMIEENGSFRVVKMANLGGAMRSKPKAEVITAHLRAVVGGMVDEHFGSGILDELFQLHLDKISKSPILIDSSYWKENSYFVFLKRV